ncbi:hypothetical protein DUI87_18690 [Hirundo rustica rustica]|uniref:Peptidase A2 domain-containing protein n=1 Tax=Hirundo rustica rustica TaxID=333673 RepID=A0A3M0KEA3_HIRRU|nr:hypothetical protein DUI87_18690 [Hirundo rustica rustica]
MANMNTECKRILRALPLNHEPTIDQMIEACAKLTSTEQAIAMAVSEGVAEAFTSTKDKGMVETGAHVTIIAHSEWLWDWELTPIVGAVSGIGGAAVSMRSKHLML